jgi:hypothetical protein
VPGFAYANIYYHASVDAGGDVAFARQVNRGNITTNFSGNLNATINADVDLYLAVPSYTFAQSFLGGQATIVGLIRHADGQSGSGRAGLHDIRRTDRRDRWFRRLGGAVQCALECRRP